VTYDPSDEESIAEEQAFRAARNKYRVEAWDWLVRDPRGRIVVAEILASTGMHMPSFTPGQFDVTAFNEGKRAVGIGLRDKIALNSSEFLPDIERQLRELVQDVGSGSVE
jgi:hypothetical protein